MNRNDRNEKPVEDDVTSDPSRDDDDSDWSDEGGATPSGPATDTPQQ